MNLITKFCLVVSVSSFVVADIGLDLQKRGNYNYNAPSTQFQDSGSQTTGGSHNAGGSNGNQIGSSSFQSQGFGTGGSSGGGSTGNGFSGASSGFSSQSSNGFNGASNGFSSQSSNDFSGASNSFSAQSSSSSGLNSGSANYQSQSSGITSGVGFQSGQGPVSNGVQLGPTYSGNVPECKKCQTLFDDVQAEAPAPSVLSDSVGPQQVEHQRHIYVFGSEDEDEQQAVQAPQAPAKKTVHHKIIFIKAPFYNPAAQQIAAQQAQREEKTIVYVLVKKPDDIKQVAQVQEQQFTPARPEVFFIKYKGENKAGQTGPGFSGENSVPTNGITQQEYSEQHSSQQSLIGGSEAEVQSQGSFQDAPASDSLSDDVSFDDKQQPSLTAEDIRIDDKPAPTQDASKDYLPPQLRRKRKQSRGQ